MTHRLLLASLGAVATLALFPQPVAAHGGQYRGPIDVVPPNPGGGRGGSGGGPAPSPSGPGTPTTGTPGPASPAPAGPGTGSPGPGGGRGPATGGGRAVIPDDLTTWQFWWEFNKDPYIRLKDALHTAPIVSGSLEFYAGPTRRPAAEDHMRPSERDKLERILPALKRAIDSTDNRDITSSCMVAMAKIGRDHGDFPLRDVFLPRLQRHDQEIRETAALAFGIAALPDARNLELLVSLAADTPAGREACAQAEVNDRTRSFACYGLGLSAHANADSAHKQQVADALRALLDDGRKSSRNVKVAAILALGLLNANADHPDGRRVLDDALQALERYYLQDLGVGEQLIQAHVPTAIAHLLEHCDPDSDLVERYRSVFADDLSGRGASSRTSHDIARSCALALGRLCRPCDDDSAPDAKRCERLLTAWRQHKDPQTRNFSMLALGQIGGQLNRSTLLKEFDKARKSLEKPWVAMAMGVFAFEKYDAERAAGHSITIEGEFGRALHDALSEVKDPQAVSALAIGLGLCRYEPAADDLRALLVRNKHQGEFAGYLCIGLALMGDARSKEDIRDIVRTSVRRPGLLQQAAIALGKLGDKPVADELQRLLGEEDMNLARLSAVASALGFIGDQRSIDPLCRMLADESLTELTRAFAAVALGGVGDKENLPWNSKIAVGTNYRAAVDTLTNGAAGVLDIL